MKNNKIFRLWKSNSEILPYFGNAAKYVGETVDIFENDRGVAISPDSANSDSLKYFSSILGRNNNVCDKIEKNLANSLNTDKLDEYCLSLVLFSLGFNDGGETLVVQDGIKYPSLYWDSVSKGVLGKELADSRGIKSIVDIFKKTSIVNGVPMRLGQNKYSRPSLVFTAEDLSSNIYERFGDYKVLLHEHFQVG